MGTKCNEYLGARADLKNVAKAIEKEFKKKEFDVEMTSYIGTNSMYKITLKKNSNFRKVIGSRKNLEIKIEGIPDKFTVCITNSEVGKNLLSTTATSIPANLITLGIPIPTMIAIGTNLYSKKRFNDNLWKFINLEIDANKL